MKFLSMLLVTCICLAGCSHADIQRRLEPAERGFDTDGSITSMYHSALYYPAEISLRWDGFIVGIEKSPRKLIGAEKVEIKHVFGSSTSQQHAVEKKLDDGKFMFVSHVLENKAIYGGLENCAVYNAYDLPAEKSNSGRIVQFAPPCGTFLAAGQPLDAMPKSWAAMDKLKEAVRIKADSGAYSAVVVVSMGWNTVQEEAIRNVNSIIGGMKAADPSLRPLVIAVTWPSQWNSKWADPVFKLFSFDTKAADADEVGLTWLGVLLHDVLPTAKGNLKTIVIGHSFGGRAVSTAACVGPAIHRGDPTVRRAPIDHLIILQGAYLVDRIFGSDDAGFHFPDRCSNVDNFVMTSSKHDEAVKVAFWGEYAGGSKAYLKICDGQSLARCTCATTQGELTPPTGSKNSKITYVNADLLISENSYLTGGGAHSDIYRREHGKFVMNAVNKKTVASSCTALPL